MRFGWIALLLLAGCATPGEVRRDGAREEFSLQLPADKAVTCMAQHAEEYASWAIVQRRDSEILVRTSEMAIVVAEVYTASPGSRAIVYRNTMAGFFAGLPAAMAKGC